MRLSNLNKFSILILSFFFFFLSFIDLKAEQQIDLWKKDNKNIQTNNEDKKDINRKNESVIWPHIGLEYGSGIYQVSQYANLVNIKNINKGNNFKIKPYVISGSQNIKNILV